MRAIDLDITMRCNVRCPGCNRLCNIAQPASSDMTVEEVESVANQMGGGTEIRVLGGEPLLHPEIIQIVDFLCEWSERTKSKFVVWTNGTLPSVKDEILGRNRSVEFRSETPEKKMSMHVAFPFDTEMLGLKHGSYCMDRPRCCPCARKIFGRMTYTPCGFMTSILIATSKLDRFIDETSCVDKAYDRCVFMKMRDELCKMCPFYVLDEPSFSALHDKYPAYKNPNGLAPSTLEALSSYCEMSNQDNVR